MNDLERVKRPEKPFKKRNKYETEMLAIISTDGTDQAVVVMIPEGTSTHSMRAALHSALRTRFYDLHVKQRDQNSFLAWSTKRQPINVKPMVAS